MGKKWKKLFFGASCVLMALCVTACTGGNPNDGGNGSGGGNGGGEEPPTDTRTEVSRDELLGYLSGSVWTDHIKTSDFAGLSAPESVGVDKERFETEVLYPVPSEEQFAAVYDVTEYGLSPDAANNAGAMRQLLNQVRQQSGLKKIFFPAGVYRFSDTVTFSEISDLYVVGEEGTEWIMTEWLSIMSVNKCTNFHINDIDFDYDPSSTVSGTVVSADAAARTVTILVDEEFDMTDHRFTGGKINRGNYMEYVWDEENECYFPDRNGMLRYNSPGDSSYGIDDGVYDAATRELTITFNTTQGSFIPPAEGKRVSLAYTMYEYGGFMIEACKNFYMESCNVYASLGMTFVTYNDENVYMNRTNLMLRPGSKRLMTATADGLHANGCFGDMIVTNSLYEASHDDAMNICSFYNVVNSVSGSVIRCSANSATTNYPIEAGDVIEIFNPDTMEVIASYTAVSVENYSMAYEVTCDKRVTNKVKEGYLVGNVSRTPKLTVDNCIIRNKRNRGILGQVRESTITNCAFYNVLHGPVMLNAARDIFAEAIVPRDITVKNCKFLNNNTGYGLNGDVSAFRIGGTVVPGVITDITVENNFFYKSANAGVYFCGTGDCSAKNNLFCDVAALPSGQNQKSAIWLDIDEDGTVTDNYLHLSESVPGFEMVRKTSATGTTEQNNQSNL